MHLPKLLSALLTESLPEPIPDFGPLYSDEPEMASSLHYHQLLLLVTILESLWGDRQDFFLGANLTVYFSPQQIKQRDFRGPDFFVVRNTERRERLSWVVWEEGGRYPDLIVELLSTSTAAIDRGLKKELYQSRFRTPEYFWFSPDTLELQGFRLVDEQYQDIPPNPQGWRWSEVLELYLGVAGDRLRYFTAAGEMVPTPGEALAQERQQAHREIQQVHRAQRQAIRAQQRLEQEKRRAQNQAARAKQRAIQAQNQVEQERQRAIQAQNQVEQERQRAIQAQNQAEQERQRAIQAQNQAEQERQRAIQAQTQAEQERQRAIQAQNQAEALRKRLEALGYDPD